MRKWSGAVLVIVSSLLSLNLFASTNDPEGLWKVFDEKDNQPRCVIQISKNHGIYTGRAVEVYPRPGDVTICKKCPKPFKNKPTKDLEIIWGLKQTGKNEWSGGRILDPQTGNIYRLKLSLSDGGKRMNARGFVGISLVGKTQTWLRKT